MDEVSVVLQASATLEQAQATTTTTATTFTSSSSQIDPSLPQSPRSTPGDSQRIWALVRCNTHGDKACSGDAATAEEVAFAWQKYLTLPGVDWLVFPGLRALAQGLRAVVGSAVSLSDLGVVEQCFGPFSGAFEKIDALVFGADGRGRGMFHGDVRSEAEASSVLRDQPVGRYLFWIDRAGAKRAELRLSYVGEEAGDHDKGVCSLVLENAGDEGFKVPGMDENVRKAEEIVALLGDLLTQPCPVRDRVLEKEKEKSEVDKRASLSSPSEMVTSVGLRKSEPFVEPIVEFADFLTGEEVARLEKDIGENATTGRLLEDKLQTGAGVFGDDQYKLAAKLFVEIIIRVAAWQKDKSYLDGVDRSPSHMIHASCFCSTCIAIHYTACAFGNIGHVYFAMGELEKAMVYFEKSLPMLREIGLWKESPKVLTRLFECSLRLDDARRIRLYGIQKIGSTQRNKNREALLLQMRDACGSALDKDVTIDDAAKEFGVGAEKALLAGKMVQSLSHFGRALEIARLGVPGQEARYFEAKALVYIGAVCYSMARTCVALVHLEEALLLLRGSKNGTAAAELQKVALGSMVKICKSAGWNKAAMKYGHELTVLET